MELYKYLFPLEGELSTDFIRFVEGLRTFQKA